MTQKVAGHLVNGVAVPAFDCIIVVGRLLKDERGTNHHGEARDLAQHRNMQTSWVEKLEYIDAADTTVITTRNSIYYTNGNLIARDLGRPEAVVTGKEAIHKMMVDHHEHPDEGHSDNENVFNLDGAPV